MTKFQKLLELLKEYNLPEGDFAVFGSAPLYLVGMVKDVNDLDVIIKPSSWPFKTKGEYRTPEIEFFDNWPDYDVKDLIDNHTFEVYGVKFVYPKKVLEYKKKMGREKDSDIWSNN